MTIEIHRAELEALIHERMKSGAFETVEDALVHALTAPPAAPPGNHAPARLPVAPTGAALVAAMQASPYREIDLDAARGRQPVRDVAF